jgi:hypothetical protein
MGRLSDLLCFLCFLLLNLLFFVSFVPLWFKFLSCQCLILTNDANSCADF